MSGMETFVHVVETGSFSGAARLLHVGQPSISKTIAQLEQRLGVHLLHRTTRGLVPTEAGQRFYERARVAIDEVNQAESAARGSDAGLSGRLRVSATVTFSRLCLIPALKPFLAQHPQLDIDFVLDDRNIDLLENGIDVALRVGDLPDSGMTARRIGRARRMVVATPAYLAAAGEPQEPKQLESTECIVYDTRGGGPLWQFQHPSGAQQRVTISGRIRATAAEGIRAAVLADLGLAIVSEWVIQPDLKQARVKQVLADWRLPDVDLWAVFPAGRRASAKARAFVGFVEQHLESAWQADAGNVQ
ncbi:LysR family transcriptional regulator [Herbaspirillum lusitanum]|uniref:LysR family transcriptional regulator n=1 Tax=Herbaspirillum lusitanum TaxID=213312 RepID=A0ABW9AFD8_9BURK